MKIEWCFILLATVFSESIFAQNLIDSTLSSNMRESTHLVELDALEIAFYTRTDSLKSTYNSSLTNLNLYHSRCEARLDSLVSLKLSTSRIGHSLDSIAKVYDQTMSNMSEGLQYLKQKTAQELKKLNLSPELSEKVSGFISRIDGFEIPAMDLNIESLDLREGIGQLGDLKSAKLSSLAGVDQLKDVSSEVSSVTAVTGEVGNYADEIQQLAKGNLDEAKNLPAALETKAAELSDIKEIEKQASVLDEYKDMARQFQNLESMKSAGSEYLQQPAMDHFAGREQELEKAMETLSKYKSKYGSVNSIKDLAKKRPNEMRGKPLIERLLPGIAVQIQKEGNVWLADLNPYLGYRFTGKLTGGAGWVQRVGYDIKLHTFNSQSRIFGPRIFAEYNAWKGICPRVEVETVNAFVPPFNKLQPYDLGTRQWVPGVFVGMKKDYTFVKNVKGTAMVMARVFDHHHTSPYGDVLNIRFGFEFPMKKKVKK